MTRRELREHCFKMLFSADFYSDKEEARSQMEHYFQSPEEYEVEPDGALNVLHEVDLGEKDSEYLRNRVTAVLEKIPVIDEKINQVAAGWKTRRMGKVELTILRLAVFEMEYDESIPQKVSINEAVELAKKFGGKDSASFVNGVLARCLKAEQKEEESKEENEGDEREEKGQEE